MPDISDLGFLLEGLPGGPLPLPAPPDGAVDPWTGQPLGLLSSGDLPPLSAPIETTIELPAAPVPLATAAPAAADESPAPSVVTLPDVPTQPTTSGTPISREEVLQLLEELNATIYLMV